MRTRLRAFLIASMCLCGCAAGPAPGPPAAVLASGVYPGGHFELQDDNSLRVLLEWEAFTIDEQAVEGPRRKYGERPGVRPDQSFASDREILRSPSGWIGTCRRDGYFEVWRDDAPQEGFSSSGSQYTPLPLFSGSQYPVRDCFALLDDSVLTTAQDQSLKCLGYDRRERWSYMLGAPARMLLPEGQDRVLAASDDGYLYAFDMDGELLWKLESASHHASLLPDGRVVYVGREGRISCADKDGAELWSQDGGGSVQELRCSGRLVWYVLDGALACLDEHGNPLDCNWPPSLEVSDLVTGLAGEMYVAGCARGELQADPFGMRYYNGTGTLVCYGAQAEQRWVYDRISWGQRIIPAQLSQCWLLDLTQNGNSLRRVGVAQQSHGV